MFCFRICKKINLLISSNLKSKFKFKIVSFKISTRDIWKIALNSTTHNDLKREGACVSELCNLLIFTAKQVA